LHTAEPTHITSIPEIEGHASPAKTEGEEGPVRIHVEAAPKRSNSISTPEKDGSSFAPMPSLVNTPARNDSSESMMEASATATPYTTKNVTAPPSSTKRLVAPNGQPRKIPLAVSFDQAALAGALEDRDMLNLYSKSSSNQSFSNQDDCEEWRVGSQPVIDKNYHTNGRVGALAAAAGRGANAFVEAFRSVVSAHRNSYKEQRN